jgi:ABC-type bacteriocin/lantibiotic exporter with double-glycine peptidase domain
MPAQLLPVPHKQQRQQADCLAACAAMVLAYHRMQVGYDLFLSRLQVDEIGTPFSNLRFLKSWGVQVKIEHGGMERLRAYLLHRTPIIVAVATGELRSYWSDATSHAIVVIGVDEGLVYVNDPAFPVAPQRIPAAEFELAWMEKDYLSASLHLNS